MQEKNNLVGYKEIQELTGLPFGTLYSMVHRKEIPHIKLGKRMVRFNLRIVHEWLEKRTVPLKSDDKGASVR